MSSPVYTPRAGKVRGGTAGGTPTCPAFSTQGAMLGVFPGWRDLWAGQTVCDQGSFHCVFCIILEIQLSRFSEPDGIPGQSCGLYPPWASDARASLLEGRHEPRHGVLMGRELRNPSQRKVGLDFVIKPKSTEKPQ